MASNSLPLVYQTIRRAQELDSLENEVEAHRYYLAAVQQITSLLQSNPAIIPSDKLPQLYVMAKQCLEQAESLFNKSIQEKRTLKGGTVVQQQQQRPPLVSAQSFPTHHPQQQRSLSPQPPNRAPSAPHMAINALRKPHSQSSPPPPSVMNNRRERGPRPQPQNPSDIHSLHKISPMEAARRKNMHLMVQYQAALKNNPTMSLPSSQNLSLGYLRRLEENLSIARYTEQTMARKLRQRELRLQEAAQRTRSRSIESLTELQLKEEVTHFEQGKSNIASLKQVLYSENESTTAVVNLIHEVLNTTDHPLRRLFGECQYGIMQYLQPIVRDIERAGDLPRLDIRQTIPTTDTPTLLTSSKGTNSGTESNESSLDPWDSRLETLRAQLLELDSSPPVTNNSNKEDITNNSNREDVINNSNNSNENEDTEDDYKTMSSVNLKEEEERGEGDLKSMASINIKEDSELESEEVTQDEEETEEEEVKFPSLPVLSCNTIYGNKDMLLSLSTKYEQLLPCAAKMIHTALDKLVSSFVLSYQPMGGEDNIDICRTALESLFFPAILPLMTTLYRCINYDKECTIAENMTQYLNATPKDLSVQRKYWLENQATPPYSSAINQLRLLPTLHCPSPKLDCLVSLSKCIVQSIEEYYTSSDSGSKDAAVVGVDDLLPIMTYVIIKSGLPGLISECSLLQEFIHEGYMMGEEGFCLTTFDTAMKYIVVMTS